MLFQKTDASTPTNEEIVELFLHHKKKTRREKVRQSQSIRVWLTKEFVDLQRTQGKSQHVGNSRGLLWREQ